MTFNSIILFSSLGKSNTKLIMFKAGLYLYLLRHYISFIKYLKLLKFKIEII